MGYGKGCNHILFALSLFESDLSCIRYTCNIINAHHPSGRLLFRTWSGGEPPSELSRGSHYACPYQMCRLMVRPKRGPCMPPGHGQITTTRTIQSRRTLMRRQLRNWLGTFFWTVHDVLGGKDGVGGRLLIYFRGG